VPTVASPASAAPPSASASFVRPSAAVQGRPSDTPFSEMMDSTAPTDPPPAASAPPPAPSAPTAGAASNASTDTAASTGNANNDAKNGAKNNAGNSAASNNDTASASDAQAPSDASKGDAATAGRDTQVTSSATADATGTVENATGGVATTDGKHTNSKDAKDNANGIDVASAIGAPAGPDSAAQAVAVAAVTVPTPVVAAVIAPLTAPPAVTPPPTDDVAAAITTGTDGASNAGKSIPQGLLAGLTGGQQKPGTSVPADTPKPGAAPAGGAQSEAIDTATADGTAPTQSTTADAAKPGTAAPTTFTDVLNGAQTPTKDPKDTTSTDKTGPRVDGATAAQTDKITALPADTHVQTPVAPPTGDQNAASAVQSLSASATAANNGMPGATPATTPAQAAAAAAATAVPIAGVAVEIVARAQSGSNRFEIRLDPPDLGRIDVRLNVDKQGNVTSHLVVDRAATLDMLRGDAPRLERALQDAGLKTGGDGLQFSLRDQGTGAQNQSFQDSGPARVTRMVVPLDDTTPIETARSYGRLVGTSGGLDIRV
jgi:flagellar hook-length control protein FliK